MSEMRTKAFMSERFFARDDGADSGALGGLLRLRFSRLELYLNYSPISDYRQGQAGLTRIVRSM